MPSDITIDTNILAHATNRLEERSLHCQAFIKKVEDSDICLCVDDGFSLIESKNKSKIACEYLTHLVPGELGFELISYLARSSRVIMLPKKVPSAISKKIRATVHDPTDHVFVKIAYNSTTKCLATHDFRNFPTLATSELKNTIGVIVVSAEVACTLL